MEVLFSNFGLLHITEKIVKNLDHRSLNLLSSVNKSLATSMKNPRIWWRKFQAHLISTLDTRSICETQNYIEIWKKLIERTFDDPVLQGCLANVMKMKLNSEVSEILKEKIETVRSYPKLDAKTPLALAVVFDQVPLIKFITSQLDPQHCEANMDLLELAFLTEGSIELIKYLIFKFKNHILINQRSFISFSQNSLLNFAAYHGSIELFEILLQLKLDPKHAHSNINRKMKLQNLFQPLTPMEVAVIRGNAEIVKRLISFQNYEHFHKLIESAIEYNKPEIVKILYPFRKQPRKDIDLKSIGSLLYCGDTFCERWSYRAAILGKADALKMLISLDDLPFSSNSPDEKFWLLHRVTKNGFSEILRILISFFEDPIARDKYGQTLLHTGAQI